ncbi:hypothetical protein D6D54_04540 [Spiroplasma poulsonii]|uniref:Uncharacterized protein n=1 Tax=Spiroplasma poulsonii TaxID=2138 RepID=A0A3S0ZWF8_9MOLU|nr:hypothetical protein [Spiroplasma poulsonii]RUP76987.1 hypothetical protein D6D54_04540 [Spiroplasma poulsonii]
MLNIIKKEVKENRFKDNNQIVIIVDEAHLAIDKDNPIALNFMYQKWQNEFENIMGHWSWQHKTLLIL